MSIAKRTDARCNFCFKYQDDVARLIAGPDVYVCNVCVGEIEIVLRSQAENTKDTAGGMERAPSCGFCARQPFEYQCYRGPGLVICACCVDLCNEIIHLDSESWARLSGELRCGPSEQFVRPGETVKGGVGNYWLKCSFCDKKQSDVKKLFAGPGVYVCNECVDLCNEILDGEGIESSAEDEFEGRIATGDPSTFTKNDFVVCKVLDGQDGEYKVTVLTGGPIADLKSVAKLSPGSMVIARFEAKDGDKIVLVDYQP